MSKTEFLQQLQQGLEGLPPEERVAAMQYYTEYLDDAGPEQMEKIRRALYILLRSGLEKKPEE